VLSFSPSASSLARSVHSSEIVFYHQAPKFFYPCPSGGISGDEICQKLPAPGFLFSTFFPASPLCRQPPLKPLLTFAQLSVDSPYGSVNFFTGDG